MIRLSEWFQSNTRRPLTIAATLVLTLWISVAIKSYLEIEKSQRNGFNQLLDVTALALSQKNRVLVESILQTARTQAHAKSVAICEGDKPLLSSNPAATVCRAGDDVWTRTLMEPIPGFANHRLAMVFPRVAIAMEQILLVCFGLILVATTLFILRRVQRKFADEVVGPLKSGILSESSLNIEEFEELRRAHHEAQDARTTMAVANAVLSITKQVSHDIRSPLSALNMVAASLKELPEEKRLIIRNAAQRINDIANGLLQHGKNPHQINDGAESRTEASATTPVHEPVMLVALLDSILSEKRTQFRERMAIEIQGDLNQGYGLFAKVNASEFSRVISNLVNNSVEAMAGPGRVTVAIRGFKNHLAVIVSDNGKGIPPEVLARLGERGVTHGKEGTQSGSGLGVYHAREAVERAGGTFTIQSQVGVGTMITLTLPRAETPPWFVEKIILSSEMTIITADDDQTIHQIWNGRLSSAGSERAGVTHLAFSSLEQFEAWALTSKVASSLFLVDYEFLSQTGNGLDAIERAGIAERAILVTSRYEEQVVRARAKGLGVRILPKALAPFVPITTEISREEEPPF